ncbi:MAG: hypothetical protein ACLP5H_10890 [Desulfomonilaceae bacterium]
MNKKEIAALLRAVADLLERTDPRDVKRLLEGRASLVIGDPQKDFEPHPSNLQIKVHWEKVKKRLEAARTTAEGLQILREEGADRTKRDLEELARHYDVAVRKSEPMANLANRIVDAVVGSRIYSETMKSLDLRSHGKTRKAG